MIGPRHEHLEARRLEEHGDGCVSGWLLSVRLFVGADVGDPIARAARDVVGQLRRRVEQQAPRARVAWVPPERMHITVRFIGDVSEDQLVALRAALEPPLRLAPFDMAVGGLGAFPARGRPRVIWAGVTSGLAALRAVERLVAARLDPVIGPGEDREYTPHLTLGRVKDPTGLTRRICDGFEHCRLGATPVAAVTLFESRLSPKGSDYVPIVRAALGSAPAAGGA
jgi:RNA 2',3'-cyclic 3'-phosphodiesterase